MLGSRMFDILQTSSDYGSRNSPNILPQNNINLFTDNFDLYCNIDTDTFLKNGFIKMSYPIDLTQCNPFCPICGNYVSQKNAYLSYESSKYDKQYLAHDSCLQKEANGCLKTTQQDIIQSKLTHTSNVSHPKQISLGCKQFYIQLTITHHLSNFIFMKLCTKLKSIGSFIHWELHVKQSDGYCPNIVALPVSDFDIAVALIEMADKDNKTAMKAFANLNKLKLIDSKLIKASTDQLQLIMRTHCNQQSKIHAVNQMNFKYRYPLDIATPVIELVKLLIKLPSLDHQPAFDQNYNSEHSSITEIFNSRASKSTGSYLREGQASIYSSGMYTSGLYSSQALSEKSYQRQKSYLQKLMATNKLGQFVRNNTQSRVFQNYLHKSSKQQIDNIIQMLKAEMPALITHQYANYMVQKLFSVCTMLQRLTIIHRLIQHIPDIVKNKQGTHTIQTLITLFTNQDQYKLICQSIKSSFLQLSQHPNATHFVQKVISIFPVAYTIDFFHFANQHFIAFAVDKNAMCVLKYMMKKINQIIENQHKSLPLILQIKRHFINSVTFNIDNIIQDSYGNYIIQFCYELFGQQKCQGITQMMIQRFAKFAIQKYASSVVYKCINGYWTNKDSLLRLKNALTLQQIIEMYRNRDSNKILLQIMEKHESSSLHDKIYNQLIQAEPTKFNQDRWGVVMGSRSGTVGMKWDSFSDAIKKPHHKKDKYYNNLH